MSSNNIYNQNYDSTKKYVVYITHYDGDKMPQNYIGSTNIKRINSGYKGSIKSKKYRQIWNEELEQNPHLFSIEIISYHDTRPEALYKELLLHQMFNIVNNPIFVNQAYATVNGFFGRDVSGKIHPMYGKTHSRESRYKISNNRNYDSISGENSKHTDQTIYIFKNVITGEIFEGKRYELRNKFNIDSSAIFEIINKGKMRKNWILAKNETSLCTRKSQKELLINRNIGQCGKKHPGYDFTIYKFLNTETKESFEGHRFDFIKSYNLNDGNVCEIINGNRKTHLNWILLEKIS